VAEDAKTGTYRAVVSKADMQAAMSVQIAKITYTSLNGAVRDALRIAAYNHCTGTMKVMSGGRAAAAAKQPWPKTTVKKKPLTAR